MVFGLSFYSWAILGLTATEDAGSLIRFCIASLHVTAGTLILTRSPTQSDSSARELLYCLPSFVAAGIVFHFARPTDVWSIGPQVLFLASTLFSIASLLFLGKNFAVFPSIRGVQSRGPYALIRHPVYAGEIGLLASCVWVAANRPIAWLAFLFAIATIVVRIVVEERKLKLSNDYQQYCSRVVWRLVPMVW